MPLLLLLAGALVLVSIFSPALLLFLGLVFLAGRVVGRPRRRKPRRREAES